MQLPEASDGRSIPVVTWREKVEVIRDWQIALILTIVCVITRAIALPASLWEWDDILFARALHRFDIPSHSPHPPGFPVFVFLARGLNLLLHNDHLALASLSLLFSCTLAAGVFYLFRAIYLDRSIAIAGSVMTIFAPAVWIHSGAARSDEPALAAGIICAALALYGRSSARALVLGSALFGLTMGIRVTLLPVVGPLLTVVYLMRLRRGDWKLVAGCVFVGIAVGAGWYLPMVLHTGWQTYREVLHQHSAYWFATDAFFSAGENSDVPRRLSRFFVDVWGSSSIAVVVYVLAGLGLGQLVGRRRWRSIGWTFLAFLPFLLFTSLLNTPMSAPLYGLGYMPFFTGLAAAGLVLTARSLAQSTKVESLQTASFSYLGITCATLVAIAAGIWTYPTIKLLRNNISPPVQAMRYLQQHLDPRQDVLLYNGYYTPHVTYYLAGYKVQPWAADEFELPAMNLLEPQTSSDHTLALGLSSPPPGLIAQYAWPKGRGRDRLHTLSLGRYFDATISDVTRARTLYHVDGWYPEETNNQGRWRWMGRAGSVAFASGPTPLTVHVRGSLPAHPSQPGHATLTFILDGNEIDRVSPLDDRVERTLTVPSRATSGWSVLRIESDRSMVPKDAGLGGDTRELAFQCTDLTVQASASGPAPAVDEREFLGEGWYNLEPGSPHSWRWAQPRATVRLSAIPSNAELTLTMRVPDSSDGTRPPVTVSIDGRVLETFAPPSGNFTKQYHVAVQPANGGASELLLAVPTAAHLPNDPRALAMCVYSLTWTPSDQ